MALECRATYICDMSLQSLWNDLAALVAQVPQFLILAITVLAVAAGVAGSILRRQFPAAGALLRAGSTFGLAGILVFVVLQVSHLDPRFEMAIPEIGLPEQQVEGGETRVPLAPDGHFWVRAEVNGVPAGFLVDTGASITTLNEETAASAGLEPRTGGIPIVMQTANGPISAQVATIDTLQFGNITASGLDAAIAPNIGRTNVLGMNMLRRLASWRVEGETMILVPVQSDVAPANGSD